MVETNKNLDPWLIAFGNKPKGFVRLLEFCTKVESGESPDREFLNDLAAVFRQMIRQKANKEVADVLMEALDLKKKPGGQYQMADKDHAFERAYLVCMYQLKENKDRSWAISKVAAETGMCHEKTVNRALKIHEAEAMDFARYILKREKDREAVQKGLRKRTL